MPAFPTLRPGVRSRDHAPRERDSGFAGKGRSCVRRSGHAPRATSSALAPSLSAWRSPGPSRVQEVGGHWPPSPAPPLAPVPSSSLCSLGGHEGRSPPEQVSWPPRLHGAGLLGSGPRAGLPAPVPGPVRAHPHALPSVCVCVRCAGCGGGTHGLLAVSPGQGGRVSGVGGCDPSSGRRRPWGEPGLRHSRLSPGLSSHRGRSPVLTSKTRRAPKTEHLFITHLAARSRLRRGEAIYRRGGYL